MRKILLIIFTFLVTVVFAQQAPLELNKDWLFRQAGKGNWLPATVPGSVFADLLKNKIIEDPFYRDNEKRVQWVDTADWEYQCTFSIPEKYSNEENINIVFEGLDTYADVYLNNKLLLSADNMFRQWTIPVKTFIKQQDNSLRIYFHAAKKKADSMANSVLPLRYPDNNRVFVRKAQYQFGWDWGPVLIGAGIWKKVWIDAYNKESNTQLLQLQRDQVFANRKNPVKLLQQKDSSGISFYFEENGKPVYARGANWIPLHAYLPNASKEDYRKLLTMAKDANMNMLRVWGGGIYESDYFYDLCDELGIMVWQDFMFAGGMYPATDSFLTNVKAEVKHQIQRLRHHSSIVLWCGNNEIDEAWHNWGWQTQFNLHGKDSAQIWNEYRKLFVDSLTAWVNEFDGTRPYVHSSPLHGWGRKQSYTEGDSHYWGLWWGLADWESFYEKTGRFVSEYGMQAMPDLSTVYQYTDKKDRSLFSPVIRWHQKANKGFEKLQHYLHRYFIDSAAIPALTIEKYNYLTQCLQYYVLKNSIAVHLSKQPYNMGSLLWQLNDCWPVTSWSIIDFYGKPKAAWYAVKNAFDTNNKLLPDTVIPRQLKLEKPVFTVKLLSPTSFSISSNQMAKYIQVLGFDTGCKLSDNFFDLQPGELKTITISERVLNQSLLNSIRFQSLYNAYEN